MAKAHQTVFPLVNFTMPKTEHDGEDCHWTPNEWFTARFPKAAELYGAAFLEGSWRDGEGFSHTVVAHRNVDFFADILGGDPGLGHQMVCHPQEDRFYFYDPVVDAFSPTTEEKLQLLISNLLVRCSQACTRFTDVTPLVDTFRTPKLLDEVVQRAKAMLQADSGFFKGESGHRRFIDGRYIESNDEPSYRQFVRKAVVACPEGRVTICDAFHKYFQFCAENKMSPLTRSEFKHLVTEVIREQFNIGFRHDVPGESGRANHGWLGIDCRLDALAEHGSN